MSKISKRVWLKDKRERERERRDDGPIIVRTDYDGAAAAWACARKKAYMTEGFAVEVARRMKSERDANVVVYACRHCGQYHIGRAPA